jgi:hypothetical protein
MPFKKGQSGNPSGRKPNTPNKTTDELRLLLQSFIELNLVDIQGNYDLLEPKEKLIIIEKLLKLVLPPPLHELNRLTDEQLNDLIEKLKKQNNAE